METFPSYSPDWIQMKLTTTEPVIENSLSSRGRNRHLYSFTTLNQEISPLVQIGPASNITASGATLSYDLISYDTNAPEITLFWGPVDHGELAGLWSYSHSLGAGVGNWSQVPIPFPEYLREKLFITGYGPRPPTIQNGRKVQAGSEPSVLQMFRFCQPSTKPYNLQPFGAMCFQTEENRLRYFSNNP